MKTIMRGLVVACCAALGLHAWAADPVAVWEDVTGASQEGGLSYEGTTVKLTKNGDGLKVESLPENTSAFTVLVKYSGYVAPTEEGVTNVIATAKNSANANRIGVYAAPGTTGGIWNGGQYENTVATSLSEDGVFAFAHASGSGTTLLQKGASSVIYNHNNLRASGNNYDDVLLGAFNGESETFTSATITIEKVAVFLSKLSQDEVNGYKWPSEWTEYDVVVDGETATWTPSHEGALQTGDKVNLTGTGSISLTVPAGAIVNANGELNVTLENHGIINVNGGTLTATKTGSQSIRGTINIAKGATFVNANDDAISWSDEGTTFNVYGTLDMGATRWTIGGSSVINCYGGCTLASADTNTRAFDLTRSGVVINVIKVNGEPTTVALPAIGLRNADSQINIPADMTVSIAKPIKVYQGTSAVKIVGGGKLAGTITLESNAIVDLGEGTPVQVANFVAAANTTSLKMRKDGSQSGEDISSTDTLAAPLVKVNSGATLNFYIKDLSGWSGSVNEHGWIVNNGTLKIEENGGTRYFRNHIVTAPGATTTVNGTTRDLKLYGGNASASLAQLYVPAPTAEATVATMNGSATITIQGETGVTVDTGAELQIANVVAGDAALAKYGAGTLTIQNNASTYSGSVTLNAGTIKSATTLAVQVPDGYTLNTDTESVEGMTIYTVTRNPGTIYVTSNTSTFVDGNGLSVTPIAADTIVVDSHCTIYAWSGGVNISQLPECVELEINTHTDISGGIAENSNVKISYKSGDNEGVYLHGNIGAGATITGEGRLYVGYSGATCTIGDGATISCGFGFQTGKNHTMIIDGDVEISSTIIINSGTIKLNADATLTTPELSDSTKVTTDVSDSHVEYKEGAYVIVADAPTPTVPEAMDGGSDDQKSAYATWATTAGVTDPTTAGATEGFILGITADEITAAGSLEAAVVAKLNTLCAQIDLSALAAGGEGALAAAVAALNDGCANGTFSLVAVPSIEINTTASLYRLTVSFRSANGQN